MNILLTSISLAVILALLCIVWLVRRNGDPASVLSQAEIRLAAGDAKRAGIGFSRAVSLIEAGRGEPTGRKRMLGQAYLGLAGIQHATGERHLAVSSYKKAREAGATIPHSVLQMLAESYAADQAGDDFAVSTYLAYIAAPPSQGEGSKTVFRTLQKLCNVSEEMKAAPRRAAATINEKVLTVRSDIEWAHYFLGLARLLDGHAAEALTSFERAHALNPGRSASAYWMCVCCLQTPVPDVDRASALLENLLLFPAEDTKSQKRRARASLEVGQRLIEACGGFDGVRNWQAGPERQALEKATRYLQIAASAFAEDASVQFVLGKTLRCAGDSTGVLAAWTRAVELNPREKTYAYQLAKECESAGDFAKARSLLRQALTVDESYWEALALLGRILFRDGQYEQAETALKSARRVNPSDSESFSFLVRVQFCQDKYGEIVREIESHPSAGEAALRSEDAAICVARSFAISRNYDSAVGWLVRIDAGEREERVSYYLGCTYANMGRLDEARTCFNAAIQRTGEFTTLAIIQRGHLSFREGQLAAAEQDYLEAQQRGDRGAEIHKSLGLLYIEQGKPDAAIASLNRALELTPQDGEAHFALGIVFERLARPAEALEHYLLVASSAAERSNASLRAGIVQCRLGKFTEALTLLGECSRSETEESSTRFYRGIALAQCGRPQDALVEWGELYKTSPHNERLKLNLARAHYLAGQQLLNGNQVFAAAQQWREYTRLYPEDKRVCRDRAELLFRLAAEALSNEVLDITRVLEYLDASIDADSDNSVHGYYLALARSRAGRLEDCKADLRRLIESDGPQSRLLYHLAICLGMTGDHAQSRALFADVADRHPRDQYGVYAAWGLANEELRDGRQEAAMALLDGSLNEVRYAEHSV